MITVVDDDQKEIFQLEVGEKIKEKLQKNVSTLHKNIMLNREKYINNKSNSSYKPSLKLTSNTIIFARKYSQTPQWPLLPQPNINSNENDNGISKNENPQEIEFDFDFDSFTMMDGEKSDFYFSTENEEAQILNFLL